jgi:hypothetical protein
MTHVFNLQRICDARGAGLGKALNQMLAGFLQLEVSCHVFACAHCHHKLLNAALISQFLKFGQRHNREALYPSGLFCAVSINVLV